MDRTKKLALLTDLGWLAALGAAGTFLLWVAVPRLLPLLAGVGLAAALQPAARRLSQWLGFSHRAALLAAALLFLLAAGAAVWGIGLALWVQWEALLQRLPRLWQQELMPFMQRSGQAAAAWAEHLLPGSGPFFDRLLARGGAALQQSAARVSADLMTAAAGGLKRLPGLLLTLLFTLGATLLSLWDYRRITRFFARQLSPQGLRLAQRVRDILGSSLLKLAKAYGLLFCIAFGLLSLGLWLLGVESFLVAALLIAVVDLLPVVGSGIVLVSWSLVVFAGGRTAFGIGLLALWGVVSLVRMLLEPKIVGDQIGLHPLVTLTAMYFGLRTAGAAGMLAFPLACLVAVRLQAEGKLRLYK